MRRAAWCAGGKGLSGSYKPASPPHLKQLRRCRVQFQCGSARCLTMPFVYVSSGSGPQERPSMRRPLPLLCHPLLSGTNHTGCLQVTSVNVCAVWLACRERRTGYLSGPEAELSSKRLPRLPS
ncbi:hypothetical protein NDU88_004329 [Pleurodeles waltl]|uniref:Uncharacterized protein n=1 Tax=Pleurodeles waltl TaxID=8319 RepID=A0AAV7PGC7_PLEWA|nr:hypothetical protein NDU88_004329 [Pleurodeles waltl]